MNTIHSESPRHRAYLMGLLAGGLGLALVLLLTTAVSSQAAHRNAGSVELSFGYAQISYAGEIVSFTHNITNGTALTDTFGIDATSAEWPIQIVDAGGALTMLIELAPGLSHAFTIRVDVPPGVLSGTVVTFQITATSQTSPTLFATIQDTVTVQSKLSLVYLPLILVYWPPVPDAPVLDPINGGVYSWGDLGITWSAANRAEFYTLEDDDNVAFSSPTVVYSGTSTIWTEYKGSYGKHYYRVKAENSWGPSLWSNVQSVSVLNYMPRKATADTTVLSNLPANNFGALHTMIVGYDVWADPPWNRARSFIQFDVSAIPSDTIITAAKMRVLLYTARDKPFWPRTLDIRRVTGAWNELTTTWTTQPNLGEIAASFPVANGAVGWYTIDVTHLVRGWVTGQYPNYGVAIVGAELPTDPNWWSFYTREEPVYEPTLQVSFPGQPFPARVERLRANGAVGLLSDSAAKPSP